jgi:hypothetical protein
MARDAVGEHNRGDVLVHVGAADCVLWAAAGIASRHAMPKITDTRLTIDCLLAAAAKPEPETRGLRP